MGDFEEQKIIAERIRSQMTLARLNPTSLSVACGFERNYIRTALKNLQDPARKYRPKHDRLKRIAEKVGCTVEYLECETDDPSVSAADLVPDTPEQRNVIARMKTLSEAGQKKIEGAVEMMTPRIIKVTGKQDEILYDGPERRVNYYPDYDGPNRRNTN